MDQDYESAPDAVVDAVVRASRALVSITVRALASVSEEVTLPQLRTLVVVSIQGPQTVSALADRLDVHASTMTRIPMLACEVPQNSAHWPRYSPAVSAVKVSRFRRPGTTSRLPPSCGTQKL